MLSDGSYDSQHFFFCKMCDLLTQSCGKHEQCPQACVQLVRQTIILNLFCAFSRAFDVELLFVAEVLKLSLAEVAVDWKEIEGQYIKLYYRKMYLIGNFLDIYYLKMYLL